MSEQRDRRSALEVASEHAALVVSGAALTLVALRVLMLAGFRPEIAVAILATADPGKIVLATMIGLLPFVLAAASLIASVFAITTRSEQGKVLGAATAIITGALSLLSGPLITLALVMVVPQTVVFRRVSGDDEEMAKVRSTRQYKWVRASAVALIVAVFFYYLTALPPFVPAENLALADGSVVVGNVIAESDGELTLVSGRPSGIVRIERAKVAGRQICDPVGDIGAPFFTPTVYLLFGQPPPCKASP